MLIRLYAESGKTVFARVVDLIKDGKNDGELKVLTRWYGEALEKIAHLREQEARLYEELEEEARVVKRLKRENGRLVRSLESMSKKIQRLYTAIQQFRRCKSEDSN